MKNKWMKKIHRRMNSCVRQLNKSIAEDNLWLGRFYAKENRICAIQPFEDGSGGVLSIMYDLIDKKTGKSAQCFITNYEMHYLFWEMNSFIVEFVKVWDENPRPSIETAVNYN